MKSIIVKKLNCNYIEFKIKKKRFKIFSYYENKNIMLNIIYTVWFDGCWWYTPVKISANVHDILSTNYKIFSFYTNFKYINNENKL